MRSCNTSYKQGGGVMAERIKGLQIDLSMKDMGVSKTIAAIKREFRSLNSSLKLSSNNFKYGEKSASSYKERMNDLDKAIKVGTSNLNELEKQYNETSKAQGANSAKAVRLQTEYNKQANAINAMKDEYGRLNQYYKENFSMAGRLSNSFKNIGSSMQGVGQKAQDVGSSLTSSITKPALVAGTAMAGITAKLGFDRLVGLDSAKAKLEGLGYSTKEVGSITDQVAKAIEGGMTTMAEGTDVAAGALAAGVKEGKDLEKYIKLVGDAAVGSNRPVSEMAMIFNRVQGQGKLMTEELNMVEEGMPGFSNAMAKHLGVSYDAFREMVTNGEVSSKEFLTVMDDFAGGMAGAYSKSWQGMVQNSKAYIGQIGEAFLSSTFEKAKGGLHEFEKMLQSPGAKQWAAETGEKLGNTLESIGNGIKGLIDWWQSLDGSTQKTLGGIVKWLGLTLIAVGPLLTTFGKLATVTGGMFSTFGQLAGGIGKVAFASKEAGSLLGGLTQVFPKLGAVVGLFANPVGLVVAGIVALGAAFVIAYKKSETFRNIVNGALQGVVDGFQFLWNGIKAIGSAIAAWWNSPSGIGGVLSKFWTENGPMLIQAFQNILNVAKPIFMALWNVVTTVFNGVKTVIVSVMQAVALVLGPILQGIKQQFINIWNLIKATTINVFNLIKGVIQGALNVILGIVKIFGGILTGDWRAVWDGIKMVGLGIMQVFVSALKFLFNQLLAFFKFIGASIKNVIVTSFQVMKGIVLGIVNILVKTAQAIFKGFVAVIKFLFTSLLSGVKVIWNAIKFAILTPIRATTTIAKKLFALLKNAVIQIFKTIKNNSSAIWNAIKNTIVNLVKGLVSGVRKLFTTMKNGITAIFNAVKNFSIKVWNAIKNGVINRAKGLWNGVKAAFNALKKGTTAIFNAVKNFVLKVWTNIKNSVVNRAKALWSGVKNAWNSLKNGTTKTFKAVGSFMSSKWSSIKSGTVNKAKALWSGVNGAWGSLSKGTHKTMNAIGGFMSKKWKGIKSGTISLVTAMKNKVTGVMDKMGTAIKKVTGKIGGFFGGMIKGVKKGLNTLIKGVNWVGDKLGMEKLPDVKFHTGTESTHTQKFVTNGKINRDTLATVGDKGRGNGPGGFRHEAIEYPNGKMALTPNKDTTTFLPKGAKVYNGAETHSMLNGLPRFSFGTNPLGKHNPKTKKKKKGDNVFGDAWDAAKAGAAKVVDGGKAVVSNVGEKAGEIVGKGKKWLKDKIGDVQDWAEKPKKLLDKVLEGFGLNLGGFGIAKKAELPYDMMKGMYGKLKKAAVDKIKQAFEEQGGDGGYIDLSRGINFGFAATAADAIKQGYPFRRPHHGLDIDYPYGTKVYSTVSGKATGSKGYNGGFGNNMTIASGIMKVIYGHLSKLNWTGTKSVKPGTFLGLSGGDPARQGAGAGSSTGPHLHYEMQKNGVPFDPTNWLKKHNGSGGKSGGSKAASKWRPEIIKALKANGLPTSSRYVNAWIRQVQTESGGDAGARQQVQDVNSGPNAAKGLLQVIPTTFAANKLPGHGNIMSGLDNAMAAMNYAKKRYGKSGMLRVIGHGHGYATGGLINSSGWYNLAEGGYPEFVIPTDPSKASDAMKLLAIASERVSQRAKNNKRPNQMRVPSQNNNQDANMIEMMAQQLEGQQRQIELLTKLVASTQNIEQQPKGFNTNDVNKGLGKRAEMMAYNLGGAN